MKFREPQARSQPVNDPTRLARDAGLRYIEYYILEITRRRRGKGFEYRGTDSKLVRDKETLRRIKSLAILPAWTGVWICPHPNCQLQATGRDARGRKQYRYHPQWREVRDQEKFGRMLDFGRALPRIRRRVACDLKRKKLNRKKALATVVRLLETTLIRVGNEEYAREKKSFGLTTMHDRHVRIRGEEVHFRFRGKRGKRHEVTLNDPRLARCVKRCQSLPGQELFQYLDEEGERHTIDSSDVNDYLREITGSDFTAKDFRTWAGTVLAARAFEEFDAFETSREARRNIITAIEAVAKMLGNTSANCRRCYVHPIILETYLDGTLAFRWRGHRRIHFS